MRNVMGLLYLAVAASATTTGASVPPDTGALLVNFDSADRIPGSYLVVFKNDEYLIKDVSKTGVGRPEVLPDVLPTTEASVEQLGRALSVKIGGRFGGVFKSMRGFSISGASDKDINVLAQDPRIERIEAAVKIRLNSSQTLPGDNSIWHLDRVDQHALPLSHSYTYYDQGSNVRVFIIDTGMKATHNEFNGGRTPLFGGAKCIGGAGCVSPDDTSDCIGHGTAVASLVGGATYGIAKNVQLYPVKVFPDSVCGLPPEQQTGSSIDLIWGIEWVVGAVFPFDSRKKIINLSGGSHNPGTIIDGVHDAISYAVSHGVTVVAAAGNDVEDACLSTPGSNTDAIIVAASTIDDHRTSFSNYGSCVDVWAPGENVKSAWSSNFGGDSETKTFSGTSASTPIVAGIAALYLSTHLSAAPVEIESAIISASTTSVLLGNLGAGSPNRLAYAFVPGNQQAGGGGSNNPIAPVLPVIMRMVLDP